MKRSAELSSYVDYEAREVDRTDHPGSYNGCYRELHDPRVTGVRDPFYLWMQLASAEGLSTKDKDIAVNDYLFSRLLSQAGVHDVTAYEATSHGYYYSDEIRVSLREEAQVHETFSALRDQTWDKTVRACLMSEYGHLLDGMDKKKFVVRSVWSCDIKIGNQTHYHHTDPAVVEFYKQGMKAAYEQAEENAEEIAQQTKRRRVKGPDEWLLQAQRYVDIPVAIVDEHDRLVDGYHRVSALNALYPKGIQVNVIGMI